MWADSALSNFLYKFSHLRTDRTGGWTAATQGQAPHKPILLLAVLDRAFRGGIVIQDTLLGARK